MGRNGLPGGAVRDPASDQNFRALDQDDKELDERLLTIEKEGVAPSGKAGGVLKGTYPNPEFATPQATKGELENEEATRASADSTEKSAREAADSALSASVNERVKGPASATNLDIAVYDGTTGKLIKDGGKTIAEVLARANHTGTQTASTISDFDTQVRTSRLDQMATPTANVSWGGKKIINLADPTEALDAANKEYVDAAASAAAAGLSVKNPVAYATTANIAGFTEVSPLILEKTAPLEVDGTSSFAVGTRLLLKNQTTEKQNGIWEVTKSETFGGEGIFGGEGKFGEGEKVQLTRTSDADTEAEVKQGMFVLVTKGTTNANTTWILTTENPIIPGTTAEVFAGFTSQPVGPAGGDLEGTYPNPKIKKEVIVNEDVSPSAAIAYSKLNLANSIKGSDLVAETVESTDLATNAKQLFLQLASAATRKVNFGEGEFEWPAAEESEASNILTVNHGLGQSPVYAAGTFFASEATKLIVGVRVIEGSFTSTQMKLRGYSPIKVSKSTKLKFMWMAIG